MMDPDSKPSLELVERVPSDCSLSLAEFVVAFALVLISLSFSSSQHWRGRDIGQGEAKQSQYATNFNGL